MRFLLTLAQSAQLANEIQNIGRNYPKFTSGSIFSMKNTPNDNFLTAQPNLTCNKLIDSARQVETQGNIKNSPNFILGEQWGNFKKTAP